MESNFLVQTVFKLVDDQELEIEALLDAEVDEIASSIS